MKNKEIVEAALKYAERGWAVFPVSKEKHPLTENGFKDASTDPSVIKEWFSHFTGANIAIATGKPSGGLVVIDVDIDESAGKFGNESLEEWCLENGCEFSDTLTATTGRGGKHYYFHSSEVFGCKVGALQNVDIRGDGGYVVVPPSKHKNGCYYKWDDEDQEIISVQSDSDVEYFLHECFKNSGNSESFEIPEEANSGSRNDTLFKIAASYQAQGKSDEEIIAAVKGYNLSQCSPPLQEKEVNTILKSVLGRYEKGKKKEVPAEAVKEEKPKAKTKRALKKAASLMDKEIPEPIIYVGVGREDPFLVEGTCILSAKAKMGKSWFVLGMCIAICKGEEFLGYKTRKCSCLYLDLESSENIQKKRLIKALAGRKVPDNFYLDNETDNIESGFVSQIENYLEQDPNIGVVVVDVFQIIRSDAKSNKETEYQHAYRDITPLNKLAAERHISIILVCHDRKAVDDNDPFSNILGSTGLQGAASQMIVMFRKKKGDPIHISVKGKTIDALPELDVKLEAGQWMITQTAEEGVALQRENDYKTSNIRTAALKFAYEGGFMGSCSGFIEEAARNGIGITEDAKGVGIFLSRNVGFFMAIDKVEISIIKNGSGARKYKIKQFTVDTVDSTVDEILAKQGWDSIS